MAMGYLVCNPRQKHNVNFKELHKPFLNTAYVTFLFSPIMDALMTLHNIEHRDTHSRSRVLDVIVELDLLNDSSQLCEQI